MGSREADLAKQGWVRKFSTDVDKVEEFVKMYEELGFQVLVEPIDVDVDDQNCRACLVENCHRHAVIYTRMAAQ